MVLFIATGGRQIFPLTIEGIARDNCIFPILTLSMHFKSYALQYIEAICVKIKCGCDQLGVVIFAIEVFLMSEVPLDPHQLQIEKNLFCVT